MALANDGLPSNVLKCIPDALWKGVNGMKKKLIKRINEIPRTVQAYSCECDVKHGCESLDVHARLAVIQVLLWLDNKDLVITRLLGCRHCKVYPFLHKDK